MKKIRDFFEKINERGLYQVVVFAILMVVMFAVYFLIMSIDWKLAHVNKNDWTWIYQIDSIEQKDDKLLLAGWAFELERDAVNGRYDIVLMDVDTQKRYHPEIEYIRRNDVNTYFMCEYDYSDVGFLATVSLEKIKLENKVYEIFLRTEKDFGMITTGTFCVDGKLEFFNPREFEAPKISGTDLAEVVNEGVLRVYRPDYGTYVYQHEGDLYWITDGKHNFDKDDYWYVQYQMNTTQVEKLPQERLENGWYWSNIGFGFARKELTEINTGEYRVAKSSIPTEYSVTKILTGNFLNDWVWKNDFYPRYEFD